MIIKLTYRTCINPPFCVSFWSAAAVLSVMWRQVAGYLLQSCIIAPCITVRLQQGYSNTKIYCKIFPPSQNYPECNRNDSILLYCINVVLYCRFLQYCAAKSTAISNSVVLFSIAGAMPWTLPPQQTETNWTEQWLQNREPNQTMALVYRYTPSFTVHWVCMKINAPYVYPVTFLMACAQIHDMWWLTWWRGSVKIL